jgi:hypothetical protein
MGHGAFQVVLLFSSEKREIPSCVSLNRTVSDVSLYVAKRRPFDFLAERPFLRNGEGNCPRFEPDALAPYTSLFLAPPEPHVLAASRMMRVSA